MFSLCGFEPGLPGFQDIQVHGPLLNTVPMLITLICLEGKRELFLMVSLL